MQKYRIQNTEYTQHALHVSCILQEEQETKEKADMEKREGKKGGKAKGKNKTQGVGSATPAPSGEVEPEVADLPSGSEASTISNF